jgi:hypothetical protein
LKVVFGILHKAGASSLDTVEVDVEFLNLSCRYFDIHSLLPPPLVHLVCHGICLLPGKCCDSGHRLTKVNRFKSLPQVTTIFTAKLRSHGNRHSQLSIMSSERALKVMKDSMSILGIRFKSFCALQPGPTSTGLLSPRSVCSYRDDAMQLHCCVPGCWTPCGPCLPGNIVRNRLGGRSPPMRTRIESFTSRL